MPVKRRNPYRYTGRVAKRLKIRHVRRVAGRSARFAGKRSPYGVAALTAFEVANAAYKRARRIRGAARSNTNHMDYYWGSFTGFFIGERKTLYIEPIVPVKPPQVGGVGNIGTADKNTYYLSGLKLCANFVNSQKLPVEVHWAIIQPKDQGQSEQDMIDAWFRTSHSSATLTRGFTPFTTNFNWEHRNLCEPLNINKFSVITHKRFTLNGRDTEEGTGIPAWDFANGSYYKKLDSWIPVKKRFRFSTETATNAERPLYFAWWYETCTVALNTTAPVQANISIRGSTK